MNRRSFFGISAATIGGLFAGSIPGKPIPKFCFGIVNTSGEIVHYSPIISLIKVRCGWNYKALDFQSNKSHLIRGIVIFDQQGRKVKSADFGSVVPMCNGDTLKSQYVIKTDSDGMTADELLEALRLIEANK